MSSSPPVCAFPLFRKKFLSNCEWHGSETGGEGEDSQPTTSGNHPPGKPMLQLNQISLKTLDLRSLGPEDSAPSESRMRRQKMAFFEKHCSEVAPGLHISGDYVAKNLEILRASGITHIVNCVGFLYQEYFKPEMTYKTLYLQGALLPSINPGFAPFGLRGHFAHKWRIYQLSEYSCRRLRSSVCPLSACFARRLDPDTSLPYCHVRAPLPPCRASGCSLFHPACSPPFGRVLRTAIARRFLFVPRQCVAALALSAGRLTFAQPSAFLRHPLAATQTRPLRT